MNYTIVGSPGYWLFPYDAVLLLPLLVGIMLWWFGKVS
jgi:hypothetical protein